MAIRHKPLAEQVIVVTGASSGIGLATARAAAEQGAAVVLAARSSEPLLHAEREINVAGGRAIHVVADVSRRDEVDRIAEAAISRFGGFDTWVNNAGVSIWGRVADVSERDNRRLFDTNFWGVVNGSLAAVQHLKSRGGALINVGSAASDFALPLQGMYSASKHAVKAFTDALRMELEQEGAPLSVTLVKPSAVNTPFPEHAQNYLDRETKLPPPVYSPEEVARAILHAASHGPRDIYVGAAGKLLSTVNEHFPRAVDSYGKRVLMRQQTLPRPPRRWETSLYQAGGEGRVHGEHPGHVMKSSLYTRATLHPIASGACLAGLTLALVGWVRRETSVPRSGSNGRP